ncbi:heavy metal-binding domain-containing protein, partial [Halovulum marinum]|uniref:heavy metal-binding domain-containing protein n=1 Tax=Halovulum marinum TaxID=2662447 RepID=UPI002278AABA
MTDHAHHSTPEADIYVCPMHPEVRQNGPGDCPKCGMHLVPESDAAAHAGHDHHG